MKLIENTKQEKGGDPGGHQWPPTYSIGSNYSFHLCSFSIVFWVPNFRGPFEALKNVFLTWKCLIYLCLDILGTSECVLLDHTFLTGYRAPQTEFVCKICTLGKLMYQLPPLGPTNLLVFHLLRLGFGCL
jgi:hypothetical protein